MILQFGDFESAFVLLGTMSCSRNEELILNVIVETTMDVRV